MRDSYDSPWKLILERHFPAFLDFFFPEVYADIDWQHDVDSLEQELRQITRDAKISRHVCDKLVRVTRRSGEEGLVLLHVEIQSRQDKDFARRMYTYNYRAFDRYGLPVASLAVLGDAESWRPDSFNYSIWRSEVTLKFPIVKLCDYNARWEELEASRNPFAVVVMAHLKTQATRTDLTGRLEWKRHLVRGLYEQRWERRQIVDLLRFLDWMLRLPSELDRQFWSEMKEYEKEKRMQYMTSFERFSFEKGMKQGKEKGLKQGIRQGMQRGVQRGIQQGEAAALKRLLVRRFGALPAWAEKLLAGATLEQLARWLDRVVEAARLEDVLGSRE